jgi:hypothetical protein
MNDLIRTIAGNLSNEKDIEATQMILSLYSEAEIYSPSYYNKFLNTISFGAKQYKKNRNKIRELVTNKLKELMSTPINSAFDEGSIARISFLKLLLKPIFDNKIDITSTYDTYNINIGFFNSIRSENTINHYAYRFDDMVSLDSFEFGSNGKLKSFILKRNGNSVSHEYNSKYRLSAIIFCDGSKLKVPTTFKAKISKKS